MYESRKFQRRRDGSPSRSVAANEWLIGCRRTTLFQAGYWNAFPCTFRFCFSTYGLEFQLDVFLVSDLRGE